MLVWVTTGGRVGGDKLQCPSSWNSNAAGARPDFDVKRIACDGNGALLESADGTLWRLNRGVATECKDVTAISFYGENGRIILETENGVQTWVLSEAAPTVLQAN